MNLQFQKKCFLTCKILSITLLFSIILGCDKNDQDEEIITDEDGNIYHSVVIGTQTWMQENLKTTKYNIGTQIPWAKEDWQWYTSKTPAYCWYNDGKVSYKNIYGVIYNWYAVNTGKLCPEGWHVPTEQDWTTLIDFLGGERVAGGKLKETGTTYWNNPNTDATNETGFTALPGGYRSGIDGTFKDLGYRGHWYISYPDGEVFLNNDSGWLGRSAHRLNYGFSVRCIKDE